MTKPAPRASSAASYRRYKHTLRPEQVDRTRQISRDNVASLKAQKAAAYKRKLFTQPIGSLLDKS